MTIKERREALARANEAKETTRTEIDVGAGLEERKKNMDAFHDAMQQVPPSCCRAQPAGLLLTGGCWPQFEKMSINVDFDLEGVMGKFGSQEMQVEFARALEQVEVLRAQTDEQLAKQLAAIAAELQQGIAARDAKFEESNRELQRVRTVRSEAEGAAMAAKMAASFAAMSAQVTTG
jgi:hypothetical protein